MEPSEKYEVIALEGELVIQRIQEIRQQVLTAFQRAGSLELDLSGVTAIDTTGLQLLCSAHRSALKNGSSFRITTPVPAALASVWRGLGLEREHGCVLDRNATCLWKSGEVR